MNTQKEYKMNGFTIRKVGDDWKVIYETSSTAEVRFIGTQEECEYFCSLGDFCHDSSIRKYVYNMRTLKVWTNTSNDWRTDWLASELSRIDKAFEEEDFGEVWFKSEIRSTYSLALIGYEMPQDTILEIAENVSNRIADAVIEIIEK